jgi:uncharacterized protein (DUF2062 family)
VKSRETVNPEKTHPTPRKEGVHHETRFQKLMRRFQEFLKIGLTPDAIALCVAVGIVVGVFPLLGTTTILAAILALIFRLNMPLIQAVNYLMAPIHLLAIYPWIRAGEYMFGRPQGHLRYKEIKYLIQSQPWEAVNTIGWDVLRAVGAWCLAAPFMILLLYWILKPISRRLAARSK